MGLYKYIYLCTEEMYYLVDEDGLRLDFGFYGRLFRTGCLFNISHCGGKGLVLIAVLRVVCSLYYQIAEERRGWYAFYKGTKPRSGKPEQCSLWDSAERPTWFWLSVQIGCDKVGGEKPHSSVVLSFPPVWITRKQKHQTGTISSSAAKCVVFSEFKCCFLHL